MLNTDVKVIERQDVVPINYGGRLRFCEDICITLAMNSDMKVNHSKFGDLLEQVTAVTGGAWG